MHLLVAFYIGGTRPASFFQTLLPPLIFLILIVKYDPCSWRISGLRQANRGANAGKGPLHLRTNEGGGSKHQ